MAKNWIIRPREPASAEFLAPNYERDLHDPFLMKDMDKAVARILAAIEAVEKIIIFGDYDADGVPGTAVLAEFFRQIKYPHFDIYLPDRHLEQYGLSNAIVEKLAKAGAKLLITVDCGIANVVEISLARSLGLDVIVTDHHLVGEALPEASAILNPKQADDDYPNKFLCGAGVAFKLVQGLIRAPAGKNFFQVLGNPPERYSRAGNPQTAQKVPPDLRPIPTGWEKWLLDLVAIATISDMVPLTGENRALVYFGLKVLRQTRRLGLLELYRKLRLRSEYLTEDDVAFSIGPRLNSASRMSHAREAYCLLTTADPATAEAVVEHLEEKNAERKLSVTGILRDLEASLGTKFPSGDFVPESLPPVLVAGHPDWSLGVLGLTASRALEKYERVIFLWGKNGNGEVRGSCRSDGTVSVVELMRIADSGHSVSGEPRHRVSPLFSNFGGHHHAGGFALSVEAVVLAGANPSAELSARLNAAYPKVEQQTIEADLIIDRELALDEVTDAFARELGALAPFGIGNPKPNFLFTGVAVARVKAFGAAGEHLELGLRDASGRVLNAIAFFNPFTDQSFHLGQHLDLVATIDKSYFRSARRAPRSLGEDGELRLRIVDLRPAS